MLLNIVFHSGYIAMFIQPYTWSFYTASVFVGIAAAGIYITFITVSISHLYLANDCIPSGMFSNLLFILIFVL